jgi:hypothetical protein
MRFRSCENRFVTTPVSVALKKRSGARTRVRRACWCRLVPARLTDTMNIAMARRASEAMAQACSSA